MTVVLGTAHEEKTPGKRSPDGQFREYEYSRRLCREVQKQLKERNIDCVIDFEEDNVPGASNSSQELKIRVQKVNSIPDAIYVSLHVNASGSTWTNARGMTVHVANRCSQRSEKLGQSIYEEATKNGLQGNRNVPYDHLWRNDFYVLKYTKGPAVLVEVAFMTNHEDVEMMLSEAGFSRIVDTIVTGIEKAILNALE